MSASSSRNDDPNKPAPEAPQHPFPPLPPSPPQPNHHHHAAVFPFSPNHDFHHQNPDPNPYPAPPRYARRRPDLIGCAYQSSVFLVFIALFIIVVITVKTHPRLPEFRVASVSLSGFNASSSRFSGDFDVRFLVTNPNKRTRAYYSELYAGVFYGEESLAVAGVARFEQERRSQTALGVKFGALGRNVSGRIGDERRSGRLGFNLRLLGLVRFRPGLWSQSDRFLRVICEDVWVRFSSNSSAAAATLMDGQRECGVNRY